MKTSHALFKQYGKKFVELAVIAPEYLGINDPKTISRLANRGDLGGIRAFKARDSLQAPWLVDIDQLAEFLDAKARA